MPVLYRQLRRMRRFCNTNARRDFAAAMSLYRLFVSPNDLVFDVGANVGYKSELFAAIGA